MLCCAVFSHSVVFDSLRPHGPARVLCPWGFSRQEYWSGLPCPPQRIFPTQGSKPGLPHCWGFFTISATNKAPMLSTVKFSIPTKCNMKSNNQKYSLRNSFTCTFFLGNLVIAFLTIIFSE